MSAYYECIVIRKTEARKPAGGGYESRVLYPNQKVEAKFAPDFMPMSNFKFYQTREGFYIPESVLQVGQPSAKKVKKVKKRTDLPEAEVISDLDYADGESKQKAKKTFQEIGKIKDKSKNMAVGMAVFGTIGYFYAMFLGKSKILNTVGFAIVGRFAGSMYYNLNQKKNEV